MCEREKERGEAKETGRENMRRNEGVEQQRLAWVIHFSEWCFAVAPKK